jgi:hypothetical protein
MKKAGATATAARSKRTTGVRSARRVTPPKFKSGSLLLDVTTGRAALARYLARGKSVHVTIDAVIDGQWTGDDGTLIEFAAEVKSVRVRK